MAARRPPTPRFLLPDTDVPLQKSLPHGEFLSPHCFSLGKTMCETAHPLLWRPVRARPLETATLHQIPPELCHRPPLPVSTAPSPRHPQLSAPPPHPIVLPKLQYTVAFTVGHCSPSIVREDHRRSRLPPSSSLTSHHGELYQQCQASGQFQTRHYSLISLFWKSLFVLKFPKIL
jgi:hypothetical protein